MMSTTDEEVKLSEKYEEILRQRAELMGQIKTEKQKNKRKEQLMNWKSAQLRNQQLLEDLKKTQERLKNKGPLHPDIAALQAHTLPDRVQGFQVENRPPEGQKIACFRPHEMAERRPRPGQERALPPRPGPCRLAPCPATSPRALPPRPGPCHLAPCPAASPRARLRWAAGPGEPAGHR